MREIGKRKRKEKEERGKRKEKEERGNRKRKEKEERERGKRKSEEKEESVRKKRSEEERERGLSLSLIPAARMQQLMAPCIVQRCLYYRKCIRQTRGRVLVVKDYYKDLFEYCLVNNTL